MGVLDATDNSSPEAIALAQLEAILQYRAVTDRDVASAFATAKHISKFYDSWDGIEVRVVPGSGMIDLEFIPRRVVAGGKAYRSRRLLFEQETPTVGFVRTVDRLRGGSQDGRDLGVARLLSDAAV